MKTKEQAIKIIVVGVLFVVLLILGYFKDSFVIVFQEYSLQLLKRNNFLYQMDNGNLSLSNISDRAFNYTVYFVLFGVFQSLIILILLDNTKMKFFILLYFVFNSISWVFIIFLYFGISFIDNIRVFSVVKEFVQSPVFVLIIFLALKNIKTKEIS